VVLVLSSTARFRDEFRRPGFWTMVGTFLLGAFPPLLWNANHDWITVEHLIHRGGLDNAHRFNPLDVFAFFGLHVGVYSPLIFTGMLVALYHGCKDSGTHFKRRFLVIFALPLLVMYFAISLKKCGEVNWTAPAFVSLGILTVAFWHERLVNGTQFGWVTTAMDRLASGAESRLRRLRDYVFCGFETQRFCTSALVLGLFMSLLLVNTDAVRRLGLPWQYRRDPTGRLHGWKTTAIAIDKIRHDLEHAAGKPLFLIANRYQSASAVAFYLPEKRVDGPGHPPVYIAESQAIENQYSFWGRYDELVEIPNVARTLLPTVGDPIKHTTLANALANATDPKRPKDGPDADDRRRALIRAMLEVNPALPLDEYASQEAAVSLFYGRDALYITDQENFPPQAIVGGFEKVEPVASWIVTRRDMPLRAIFVFLCHNYHNLPL